MKSLILILTLFFCWNSANATWIHRVPPQEKSAETQKVTAAQKKQQKLSKRSLKLAKSKNPSFREQDVQRDTLGMVMMYIAFILIAFGAFALLLSILPTVAAILAGLGIVLLIAYLVFFVMAYA